MNTLKFPTWAKWFPWNVITDQAKRVGIEARLLAAVIQKETAGVAFRTRFEPAYQYYHEPVQWASSLGITLETEKVHQKTSWGLMQVMGGTAREMGFRGYMPELCDPALGIHYGAKYLRQQYVRFGSAEKALAAYNGGGGNILNGKIINRDYCDAVMRLLADFT